MDGIILYGGINEEGIISGKIYQMRLNLSAIHDDDPFVAKQWNLVNIKGIAPSPRKSHSFDLLPEKGLCVMIGGINTLSQYCDDLWILDLYGLNWIQIT